MNDPLPVLQTELRLSKNESRLFLYLVKTGRRTIDQISADLNCSRHEANKTAQALVDLGMIVHISELAYMPLHPRFAIVNRYREICREDNVPFRRNVLIDNIGIVLEKYFDHINV
jgi:sugar-specific transcriptional regulator TrmB